MNIRRFRAHNVSEALAMVKAEMGDDAVILNTARRRIRSSSSGTATSIVEVVAAVDFDVAELDHRNSSISRPDQHAKRASVKDSKVKAAEQRGGGAVNSSSETLLMSDSGSDPDSGKINNEMLSPPSKPSMSRGTSQATKNAETSDAGSLQQELTELRSLVEKMANSAMMQAGFHSGAGASSVIDQPDLRGGVLSSSRYPLMVMQEVFDFLGMDPSIQRGLASAFLKAHPSTRPVNHRTVYSWLRSYCRERIVTGPVAHSAERPCWWAFIGPTGVGKTTTLAKVAAHLKFRHGMRGHLVTVDTYRLGGLEQLKKYAALMEIPFSTAKNTGELVKVFSENRDLDFILVDTIGRNSRSSRHHVELEKMFDAVPGLMAQAFLCAAYRSEDMAATVKTYRQFPVCGWTISKADETGSPGALCTPVLGWRLPLSYITDGQKVPEDIKTATHENVMKLLFSKGDAHFIGDSGCAHVNTAGKVRRDIAAGHAATVEGQR